MNKLLLLITSETCRAIPRLASQVQSSSVLAINNNAKNQDEKIARIYQDKKLIYTIDLNSVKETHSFPLGIVLI